MRAPRRRRGLTLIEIVAALMIFALMGMYATWATAGAYDQALGAERARQLRMLAERQIGEALVFERVYDDERGDEKPFEGLPDDLEEMTRDWHWRLDVSDTTAFGENTDPAAPHLFGDATTDATAATTSSDTQQGGGSGTDGQSGAKKGEKQLLRQVILTVTAASESGDTDGDTVEIVMFLPPVSKAAAAAPAPAGGSGN